MAGPQTIAESRTSRRVSTSSSRASSSTTYSAESYGSVTPPQPTAEDLEQQPWRYVGYRGYSKFISSDDDFFILRRFASLNVRVALSLQQELVELERQLDRLDDKYTAQTPPIHNGRFQGDEENRVELLKLIAEKLKTYNEFVIQQSALRQYGQAPQRDVKNINRWHHNHDYKAIDAGEQQYLHSSGSGGSDGSDLISIVPKDKAPLRRLIDHSLRLRTLGIWRVGKSNREESGAAGVSYYSDKRIDAFVSTVIVAIGAAILLAPLWILKALEDPTIKLVVITVFISVFLLVLSFVMVAKPFEALGATAGYAAVLMVFIQLGTGS